ncbi:MAG: hypothetical protein QNJ67_03835 [Kiloniellales bacterium]|nr:hypothetical protein [Kiloniellales bacterium]
MQSAVVRGQGAIAGPSANRNRSGRRKSTSASESGPMHKKIYLYLVLSETGPSGGRVITSYRPPRELTDSFEANHPGWYVKHVWSVTRESGVGPAAAAIKAAYPSRTFA